MLSLELFALFAVVGAVAGFFSGLLGVGGGIIITPLLATSLTAIYPEETATHAAIATSLAAIFFTSAPGAVVHAVRREADWKIVILITAGASVGSLAVGLSATNIPGTTLRFMLSVFLLYTAYSMFYPSRRETPITHALSSDRALPAAGMFIGGMAALLGIGGGVLSAPLLAARGLSIKRCIGTWAVYNNPLAFFAAAGYIVTSASLDDLPEYAVGYVYLPALFGITTFSMMFAYFGARRTGDYSELVLRRLLGGIVGILALRLLYFTLWG